MSIPHPTGFQTENPEIQAQDRGLLDCFGKKAEKDDVSVPKAEHKPSLMEKLHRSNSSSSSSSEEEVEEGGVKIRNPKKKGLTDKIKEKLPGGHKNEGAPEGVHPNEENGFLEKVKEKVSGHQNCEAGIPPHSQPGGHCGDIHGAQGSEEKKGIIEKIMEKFPGGTKDGDGAKKDH